MSVESRIRGNLGDLCKGSAKEGKELKLRAKGGSMRLGKQNIKRVMKGIRECYVGTLS